MLKIPLLNTLSQIRSAIITLFNSINLNIKKISSLDSSISNLGDYKVVETTRLTGTTDLTTDHYILLCDTDDGVLVVKLLASPENGRVYIIKNVGTSGNGVTVNRNGKRINGVAANPVLTDGQSRMYVYETTEEWHEIANK